MITCINIPPEIVYVKTSVEKYITNIFKEIWKRNIKCKRKNNEKKAELNKPQTSNVFKYV